jgi:hypothetical protein
MRRLQRAGDLGADPGHPLDGQRPAGADQVGQRWRVDQLHDDEGAAPVLDDVVQRDRGRVVEPGGGPRLPHHPRLGRAPLLLGHGRREHHLLDRDLAAQDRILGTPDNAHPSPPEGGSERVAIGDQAVGSRCGHIAPPYPLAASTNRSGRWWDKGRFERLEQGPAAAPVAVAGVDGHGDMVAWGADAQLQRVPGLAVLVGELEQGGRQA